MLWMEFWSSKRLQRLKNENTTSGTYALLWHKNCHFYKEDATDVTGNTCMNSCSDATWNEVE